MRDLADREVAVDRERERARDRRGGHMERVRHPPLRERLALLDAEAVLLVDHGDGEVAQVDAFLDERVRADEDARAGVALALRHRAGQQPDADADLPAELLDREEVLLGERLGRRHQRAAVAAFYGAQQRVERDDRLPRADVSLQEPLHGRGAAEVGVDLGDGALLVGRELERQRLPVALDQLTGRVERRRDHVLFAAVTAQQAELECEQLVEGQPAAALLGLLFGAGTVERPERVGAQRQVLALLELRRQRVGQVPRMDERGADQLAQLLRRHVLAGGIHRREIRRRDDAVQVERADVESVPSLAAAQAHVLSCLELPRKPGLVEPGRGDRPAAVRDLGGQDLQPAASPLRDREDLPRDCDVLVAEQVGDAPLGRRRLVPARPVTEEVADRPQPELGETALDRRPDAIEHVDRPLQRLRVRSPTGRRPLGRWLHAGEAARKHGVKSRSRSG